MDIKVLAIGRAAKSSKGNPILGVKHERGWVNLSAESKADLDAIQKDQIITITDPEKFGNAYYAFFQGFPKPPAEEQPLDTTTNEQLSWADYITAMQEAHRAAKELEPDDGQARCALVNTAMIAFSNHKVRGPGDGTPF